MIPKRLSLPNSTKWAITMKWLWNFRISEERRVGTGTENSTETGNGIGNCTGKVIWKKINNNNNIKKKIITIVKLINDLMNYVNEFSR